jgi:hypothetical protein
MILCRDVEGGAMPDSRSKAKGVVRGTASAQRSHQVSTSTITREAPRSVNT